MRIGSPTASPRRQNGWRQEAYVGGPGSQQRGFVGSSRLGVGLSATPVAPVPARVPENPSPRQPLGHLLAPRGAAEAAASGLTLTSSGGSVSSAFSPEHFTFPAQAVQAPLAMERISGRSSPGRSAGAWPAPAPAVSTASTVDLQPRLVRPTSQQQMCNAPWRQHLPQVVEPIAQPACPPLLVAESVPLDSSKSLTLLNRLDSVIAEMEMVLKPGEQRGPVLESAQTRRSVSWQQCQEPRARSQELRSPPPGPGGLYMETIPARSSSSPPGPAQEVHLIRGNVNTALSPDSRQAHLAELKSIIAKCQTLRDSPSPAPAPVITGAGSFYKECTATSGRTPRGHSTPRDLEQILDEAVLSERQVCEQAKVAEARMRLEVQAAEERASNAARENQAYANWVRELQAAPQSAELENALIMAKGEIEKLVRERDDAQAALRAAEEKGRHGSLAVLTRELQSFHQEQVQASADSAALEVERGNVADLRSELDQAQRELHRVRVHCVEVEASQEAEMSAKLSSWEAKAAALQHKCEAIQQQEGERNQELSDARRRLSIEQEAERQQAQQVVTAVRAEADAALSRAKDEERLRLAAEQASSTFEAEIRSLEAARLDAEKRAARASVVERAEAAREADRSAALVKEAQLELQVSDAQQRIRELQGDLEEAKMSEALEAQRAATSSDSIEKLQSQEVSAMADAQHLREAVSTLEEQAQQAHTAASGSSASLRELELQVARMEATEAAAESALTDAKEQMLAQTEERQAIEDKYRDLAANMSQTESKLAASWEELAVSQRELEESESKSVKGLQTLMEAHKKLLAAKDALLVDEGGETGAAPMTAMQLFILQGQLDGMRAADAILQDQLEPGDATADMETLSSEKARQVLDSGLLRSADDDARVRQRITDLEKRLEEELNAGTIARADLEAVAERSGVLQVELAESRQRLQTLEDAMADRSKSLEKEAEDAKMRLQQLQVSSAEAADLLEAAEARNGSLTRELEEVGTSFSAQMATLEAKEAEKEERVEASAMRSATLQQELEEMSSSLSARMAILEVSEAEANEKHQAAEARNVSLQQELDELRRRLADQLTSLEANAADQDSKDAMLQASKEQVRTLELDSEAQGSRLAADVKAAQAEALAAREELQAMQAAELAEVRRLQEEVEAAAAKEAAQQETQRRASQQRQALELQRNEALLEAEEKERELQLRLKALEEEKDELVSTHERMRNVEASIKQQLQQESATAQALLRAADSANETATNRAAEDFELVETLRAEITDAQEHEREAIAAAMATANAAMQEAALQKEIELQEMAQQTAAMAQRASDDAAMLAKLQDDLADSREREREVSAQSRAAASLQDSAILEKDAENAQLMQRLSEEAAAAQILRVQLSDAQEQRDTAQQALQDPKLGRASAVDAAEALRRAAEAKALEMEQNLLLQSEEKKRLWAELEAAKAEQERIAQDASSEASQWHAELTAAEAGLLQRDAEILHMQAEIAEQKGRAAELSVQQVRMSRASRLSATATEHGFYDEGDIYRMQGAGRPPLPPGSTPSVGAATNEGYMDLTSQAGASSSVRSSRAGEDFGVFEDDQLATLNNVTVQQEHIRTSAASARLSSGLLASSLPVPADSGVMRETPGGRSLGRISGNASDNGSEYWDNGAEELSIPEAYLQVINQVDHYGWDSMDWSHGYTLLHWAAKNNYASLCVRFMAQKADPEVRDDRGESAVDYALEFGSDKALLNLRRSSNQLPRVEDLRPVDPMLTTAQKRASMTVQAVPVGSDVVPGSAAAD